MNNRRVLAIALPIMASNVSEPLIGLVDTAVIGQLPDAHYIGAIAVGALIFSFVYWGFGFLRMGTGGLTAQAFGAGDKDELRDVLGRALLIAGIIGLLLIALSKPIEHLAFSLMQGSEAVESEAAKYFQIRIWSAPFALANYAMLGWFIGMGATPTAFAIQLVLNITNMVLDAVFVLGFGMAAEGVGLGTLLAEVIAALLGFGLILRELNRRGGHWSLKRIFNREKLFRTFAINGDIMVRTFCLALSFWWFTSKGAQAGDTILAANAVLMQFTTISAFLIDGFAHSAEVLTGQSVGARNRGNYHAGVRLSTKWAFIVATIVSVLIIVLGPFMIDFLTVNEMVRETARIYLWWTALTPLLGAACFQLDGIFIGATQTKDMRNMMIVSLLIFLAAAFVLAAQFGNHGLWAALCIFYVVRGASLYVRLPALERTAFGRT